MTPQTKLVRINADTLQRLRDACAKQRPPVALSAAVTFAAEQLLATWRAAPPAPSDGGKEGE
jgi:hypothetical protein